VTGERGFADDFTKQICPSGTARQYAAPLLQNKVRRHTTAADSGSDERLRPLEKTKPFGRNSRRLIFRFTKQYAEGQAKPPSLARGPVYKTNGSRPDTGLPARKQNSGLVWLIGEGHFAGS